MSMTFVLTGARTNYTGKLGKGLIGQVGKQWKYGDYVWRRGQMALDLPDESWPGIIKYLRRTYRAFPAGSEALREAQEQDRDNQALQAKLKGEVSDQSEVHPSVSPGHPEKVPSINKHGGPPSQEAAISSVAASASGRSTGIRPDGDRSKDSGDDRRRQLAEAVASLDRDNDEHWTQDGKPRIDAVEAVSGLTGVSRADVDAAAPSKIRST